ncbi:MFS transporter, ACS family, tartrate transporter [Granulicella pectinivorans]|uniref:MFS transporter, ACS family, tartrate transporter n=2 Tax=Granulicella pectinivorans TaxID=474950 RepID=A0A1I6M982_9BACT|nr:MFS transporter, ACS family, tartrate transporter [Granulicella pectinivorans]
MNNPAPVPDDLEARVMRRISWRILPFVMLLYFISFLDRVNVGFAAITMNKEIGLSPAAYGLGGGLFFIGYFLFEVPSNLLLYRVGVRLWIARVMVTWGIVSACSAFVTGPHSFFALRFLLGIAEAGFFPGIILYLSLWFPARYRAIAAAAFMAAAPISTAIGSPISGALMELPRCAGLSNWQWLYLIEAAPAIVLGFVVLKALTDKPEDAKWLAADEREWLVARLKLEQGGASSTRVSGLNTVWETLCDFRVLALSLIYLGTSAGLYTLGLWAPLILRRSQFSSMQTGWINALPSVVAVLGMTFWARHSDRTLERTWHVVIPCVAACLGFIWAGSTHSATGVILALVVVNVGISAAKAPLWAMASSFLSGASAAAGIATINSVGNLGGFIGPYMIGWIEGKTGSYTGGLYLVGATLGLSAVLTLLLSRK